MIWFRYVLKMEEIFDETVSWFRYFINMLTEGQIQCMKEDMTAELAQILIEEQHYSMEKALDIVYNSATFRNLRNSATGFYYQSVGYVYSYLQDELETI